MGELLAAAEWTGMVCQNKRRGKEMTSLYLKPEREQIRRYAEAFYGLAKLFQDMPCQKERLSDQELEQLFDEVRQQTCINCSYVDVCWKKQYFQSCRMMYELLSDLEYDGAYSEERLNRLEEQCVRAQELSETLEHCYTMARQLLLWNNQMLEQRMAAGEQIYQTAELLRGIADGSRDVPEQEKRIWKRLKRELHFWGIELCDLYVFAGEEDRMEMYLMLRAEKQVCVSAKSIAEVLSDCCGEKMRPSRDCRAAVRKETEVFHFVPDTRFQICCGIARLTKSGELVSGDNYAFLEKDTGKVVMSLADGMGSGVGACRESERVIELLEQFLEAGFPQETAVRMINSCMLLQNSRQMFSSIDLCMIDLYNATCDLIKSGAAATFIKRGNEIEVLHAKTFPAGMLQQSDYESMHRKLQSGSTVIMMTDGVLEALPEEDRERKMAELIVRCASRNAREYAQRLLERAYMLQQMQAKDDMTVLIGTIWEKQP